MGAKKPRTEKLFSEDDAALVLDYLRTENRPYSALDISTNLHNKISKTSAAKILKELQDRKQIEARVSGKQVVYHALQEAIEDDSPEAAATRDDAMRELKDELSQLKAREKELRQRLTELSAIVPINELRKQVALLEQEQQTSARRLEMLQAEGITLTSSEEIEQVEQEWRLWTRRLQTRIQISRELWARCTEVLPEDTTVEDLKDDLGLEGEL